MMVFAHISDTHMDGGDRAAGRTTRVMAYLNGLARPVDALLVTGDIADNGKPVEYEEARRLIVAPYPVLYCPGNHDERSAYREVLLDRPDGDAPINQVHRVAGVVFAMCDSTIPGRDDGMLTDETISWLADVLAGTPDGTPVFIGFHHPPAILGIPYIDDIRQLGERRLAELVAGDPRIVAVLCGHAHSAAATTFAGKPLLVAAGVVSTVRLPWERGDLIDLDQPPGVAFHVLDDEGRLTTHYRVVP